MFRRLLARIGAYRSILPEKVESVPFRLYRIEDARLRNGYSVKCGELLESEVDCSGQHRRCAAFGGGGVQRVGLPPVGRRWRRARSECWCSKCACAHRQAARRARSASGQACVGRGGATQQERANRMLESETRCRNMENGRVVALAVDGHGRQRCGGRMYVCCCRRDVDGARVCTI